MKLYIIIVALLLLTIESRRHFRYVEDEPRSHLFRTDIGDVQIIGSHDRMPDGYRVMTFEEGSRVKSQLSQMLGRWAIVGFDRGKLDGAGYGNRMIDMAGAESGQKFVIRA
jgi:hypothetical protein